MRPVYVCQLPDEMQREIRSILTRLFLYQCGKEEKAEEYFDMSLTDAVQLGMDSRIIDIDCVADSFRNGSYIDGEAPENIRKDAERLAEILRLRIEMEEKFLEEYSTHGTSVSGSREDIRQDLEVDETFQEER